MLRTKKIALKNLYKRIDELTNELETKKFILTRDQKADIISEMEHLTKMANEMEDRNQQTHDYGDDIKFVIKTGVEIAGITLPLLFYSKWFEQGLEFEETGVFTATTFKNFFNKLKP